MFTLVRQQKLKPECKSLIRTRRRYRPRVHVENSLITVPSTHILCSAHVFNGKDRDHVLHEIELNKQGLGLELLTSAFTDGRAKWHIYNPGFQIESQFVDIYAYLEKALKVKLRFLVTYSIVQRKLGGRQERTMSVIVSLDNKYNSVTMHKVRALLMNAFSDTSKGLYDHLRLTVVFHDIRVVYADLNIDAVPVINVLDPPFYPKYFLTF